MLQLPDIRQRTGWDCGKAAVECVLRFFGSSADLRKLGTSPMDGTDPRAIETCLRLSNHQVISGEMDLDDLRYFTKTGRPVIAVVNGHYVTVAGIARGKVHYQDPWTGPCKCKPGDFLGWWKEADRLGVTYRHFGIAVS